MFYNIFTFFTNLFSDCFKYPNDQSCQEAIDNLHNEYYSRTEITYDPLWQDRRLLSLLIYRKKNTV